LSSDNDKEKNSRVAIRKQANLSHDYHDSF
jgi:hypothetical protein